MALNILNAGSRIDQVRLGHERDSSSENKNQIKGMLPKPSNLQPQLLWSKVFNLVKIKYVK